MAARRRQRSWPEIGLLGPFPDLACTALASTVREELEVAAICRVRQEFSHLRNSLALEGLLQHEMHALSGGEAVRVALASIAAQGIEELHVDTALEQLDQNWRHRILTLLRNSPTDLANRIFVSDNHIAEDELEFFASTIEFPLPSGDAKRHPHSLDPAAAGGLISKLDAGPISIEQVSFSYGRRSPPVFHKVSLTLEPGSLYFLCGDNGSGKSTFVKLLSGTLLPREGGIRYGTEDFRPTRSSRRFASLAFQNPDFQWTSQTVQSELAKTRSWMHSDSSKHDLLPIFGMPEDVIQSNPNELPFALKKRLGIALAVLSGKPWLVLDEPTLGQDKRYQNALADLLGGAVACGTGVMVISHDAAFRSLLPRSQNLVFRNATIAPDSGRM